MSERTRIVLVFLCAFLAALVSYRYLAGMRETTTVVIAAREIPAGTKIEEAMLSVRTVTKQEQEILAPLAIRESSQVLGRAPKRLIEEGAVLTLDPDDFYLTDEALKQAKGENVPPAYLLPAGLVAVAVPVEAESSVGFTLQTGDRVNVLVTGKRDNEVITQTVLRDVEVFDVGKTESAGLGGGDRNGYKTVTVLVSPQDAERLVNAKRTAKVDLALTGR